MLFTQYCWDNQNNEMGRSYDTCDMDSNVVSANFKGRDHLEDLGADRRKILKSVFLAWLRIRPGVRRQ
jgi:hypothetical protein